MTLESNRRFFLAFVNHVLWSTLAVASRYLQVFARPQVFDGQGVLATAKATSAILLFTCGHFVCPDRRARELEDASSMEETEETTADAAEAISPPKPAMRTKIFFALLFGVLATCRASLNIASAKFTLSYYISKYKCVYRLRDRTARLSHYHCRPLLINFHRYCQQLIAHRCIHR